MHSKKNYYKPLQNMKLGHKLVLKLIVPLDQLAYSIVDTKRLQRIKVKGKVIIRYDNN